MSICATSWDTRFIIYNEIFSSKNSILVSINDFITFICMFLLMDMKTKVEMYFPIKVLKIVEKVISSIFLVN